MEELHKQYSSAAEKARVAALDYKNAMLVDMLKRLWLLRDELAGGAALADLHVTHAAADFQGGPLPWAPLYP